MIGEILAAKFLWPFFAKTQGTKARAVTPVLPGRSGSSVLYRVAYRAPCHVIEDHIHVNVHLMLTAVPHHVSKG